MGKKTKVNPAEKKLDATQEICPSFGIAWNEEAEECVFCKDQFPGEYTACKQITKGGEELDTAPEEHEQEELVPEKEKKVASAKKKVVAKKKTAAKKVALAKSTLAEAAPPSKGTLKKHVPISEEKKLQEEWLDTMREGSVGNTIVKSLLEAADSEMPIEDLIDIVAASKGKEPSAMKNQVGVYISNAMSLKYSKGRPFTFRRKDGNVRLYAVA